MDLHTTEELKLNDILQQLMEKIEKISIKNTLQDKLIINRITSDTIEFITISKVAQLVLNNIENIKYLENKLSEILGKSITIKIKFESKEDYFSKKLNKIYQQKS